jgi:hypothetical protein
VTGDGDVICVEAATGAVVHFNHDRGDDRILINSSLQALMESLCIYLEASNLGRRGDALQLIREVDPGVVEATFWARESR